MPTTDQDFPAFNDLYDLTYKGGIQVIDAHVQMTHGLRQSVVPYVLHCYESSEGVFWINEVILAKS